MDEGEVIVYRDVTDEEAMQFEEFEFTVENLMALGHDRKSAEYQVAVHFGDHRGCCVEHEPSE